MNRKRFWEIDPEEGGDREDGADVGELRQAFNELGEALLDTGPGRFLLRSLDALGDWITLYDERDDGRSCSFGLIAGWWAWKRKRISVEPDFLNTIPASILTMEPVGGPIRVAFDGEATEDASVLIAWDTERAWAYFEQRNGDPPPRPDPADDPTVEI